MNGIVATVTGVMCASVFRRRLYQDSHCEANGRTLIARLQHSDFIKGRLAK